VASQLAVETLATFIRKSHHDRDITWPYGLTTTLSFDGNRLLTAISLANKRVFRAADGRPDYTGLGTTAVAALIRESTLTVGWVGDSRAYLFRDGAIEQLTVDHTWVNMARQEGKLSADEAESHRWKHILTRALGGRESVEVDLVERPLEPGDVLLLCSDGLTGMIGDQEIQRLLAASYAGLEGTARDLIAAANEAGGKDNITVILVRYVEAAT
jgi:PPM family protein phosphatase